MFGEERSTSATIRLQNHISRLRKRLGASTVVTVPRGYRLDTDVVELDWLRFEGLLAAASGASDAAVAATLFEEALGLWQGEPFTDVEEWEPAHALATRLEELRRVAQEDYAAAHMAAGRSASAVSVLETLATQEPLRERRWSLLMLALYRCARQADALRTYQRACDALAEIGLEPGPDLRQLERAISVHDVSLGVDALSSVTAMSAPTTTAPVVDEAEPASTRRSNLPSPADSFVGRQRELIQLADALAVHRLVTIVGVGGMGKTRLAVEAAARTEAFDDGTWLVDLGLVPVHADVDRAVAAAIGVRSPPGAALSDAIAEWCSRLHALIILDNCEHVLDGVGRLMGAVLQRQPSATFLATSREPLLIAGEHVVPLGPLPVVAHAGASPDSDALVLLIDRVREERPDFDPTADRTTLAEICVRLDGMPLALELAAARLRALTPAAVAERLDERFRLLTGGRRNAVARHKTLRATVDWSYDLLDGAQRRLFECLSVLAGPFGLDDVAALHGGDDAEHADTAAVDADVVAHLAELVDRSLVIATSDEPPYRMLETLRAYGRERLLSSGAMDAVRERHARWFAVKAARTRADACGPADATAWTWAIAQNPDYEAAATWAVEHGQAKVGMGIASDLVAAFWSRMAMAFGTWAGPLAEHVTAVDLPVQAQAYLRIAEYHQFETGDLDRADSYFEAAIEADPTAPFCHIQAGVQALLRRQPERVLARANAADAVAGDDRAARAAIYILLANAHFFDRPEEGRPIAEAFLHWAQRLGWPGAIGHALFLQACADQDAFPKRARAAFDEADRIAREIDSHGLKVVLVRNRFRLLVDHDPAAAAAATVELLRSSRRQGDSVFASVGFAHATILLVAAGDATTAARLVGKLDKPLLMSQTDIDRYTQAKDELRDQLGDRADHLAAQGAATSLFDLIELACASLAAAYPTDRRPSASSA